MMKFYRQYLSLNKMFFKIYKKLTSGNKQNSTKCTAKLSIANANAEYIIILHGITKNIEHMNKLITTLQKNNYNILQINYPSTSYKLDVLASLIINQINTHIPKNLLKSQKVHFIGHSMGGLLIRTILKKQTITNLGKVIMIAPPNFGSEIADFLQNNYFYKKLFGPAGKQLITNQKSFKHLFQDENYELGIIAGNKSSYNLIIYFLLPKNNDGRVSVASTKLPSMKDHITIYEQHNKLPNNHEVIWQILNFLQYGKFIK